MDSEKILQEFIRVGAILKGHFILSSGLHSDTYVQCAKLCENPRDTERICGLLIDKIKKSNFDITSVDTIVSPALGGIIFGYDIARQLGLNFVFCERVNGEFTIRRGFEIKADSKILIIEDVLTTGKSTLETFKCVEDLGGVVIGCASLVRRSDSIKLPFPVVSLLELNIVNFEADNLPKNLKDISPIKPGSRHYLSEPK